MKLLIDHNLSHKLLRSLSKKFPNSVHVKDLKMEKDDDLAIWKYAGQKEYTILLQDSDLALLIKYT